MKFSWQKSFDLQVRVKSVATTGLLERTQRKFPQLSDKIKSIQPVDATRRLGNRLLGFLEYIKAIGLSDVLDDYENRKLGIFNLLNFFQFITGILVPLAALFSEKNLPGMAWLIACAPAFISVLVLWLNATRRHEAALISYFILYPVATSIVYLSGMNLGMELFFILYGILSVFFIQELSHMLFSLGLSMISYFMLAVVWNNYPYQLEKTNVMFYLFNQLLAIVFIFYGLFLIKKENTGYQFSIIARNRDLHAKNLEIEKQKKEIADNAALLEKQKGELTELNGLKNKLFSVIAHDLKSPIYALHSLFRNMQQYDLPAEDIKAMVPDVVNDLNFTTGLMENLLQWARSQMQQDTVKQQTIDVSKMAKEVIQLLRLPAEAKELHIKSKLNGAVLAMADKDMVNLVLRNLLSNAIKFTPARGTISIGMNEMPAFIEVYVEDSGIGITGEILQKINKNDYYTSKGTANESGTGLGLMLCKEFLARNGGTMNIESVPGRGSIFSFTLPRPATA